MSLKSVLFYLTPGSGDVQTLYNSFSVYLYPRIHLSRLHFRMLQNHLYKNFKRMSIN